MRYQTGASGGAAKQENVIIDDAHEAHTYQ